MIVKRFSIGLGIRGALLVSTLLSLGHTIAGNSPADLEIKPHPGEVLARRYCQTCHLFAEPDLLPKNVWKESVLPKMSFYMGVQQIDMEKTKDAELLKASGLFPPVPLLPKSDFATIEQYYLERAPEEIQPQPPKPEIELGLKHFRVTPPAWRRDPPLTTLVSINSSQQVIYTADAMEQNLDVLSSSGEFMSSIPVGNIPVSLVENEDGIYLACIGHFFPVEERLGQVILLKRSGGSFERKVLFSNLPRPAHIEFGDLDGDGKEDFALSMFGYLTGRFSWFKNLGADQFEEKILINKAGAVRSVIQDFTGDGQLDIAVLMGQELESLILFENEGEGEFTQREIFKHPPSYGHTYFEAVDFNQDERVDFLVTNGDNGDYESPPKPYHGVRLYLNQGDGQFRESFFYPAHGAFKALARDFDEDGDLDIAVISFFPDYEKGPRESFIYLENRGNLQFDASTFPQCISGRWVCMDAADADDDGDLDIVLGSLIRMPTEVPEFLKEIWEKSGPSVLILENTLR